LNLDDFSRVSSELNLSIVNTLEAWFPNGVLKAGEFCIGSSSGEAGQSLRIRTTGDKIGVWADFSEGEAGRDLISLYAFKEGITQGQACVALAEQLGIALTDNPDFKGKKAKPARVLPIPPKPQKSALAQAAQGVEEAKPRTEWTPVLPVPLDAGDYPKAHVVRGHPERTWEYRDYSTNPDGDLLGVIFRFVTSDGGKEVLPCVYARHPVTGASDWRWLQFRDPRPLYMRCALRPELPVLVVEGEKCVDAAFDLLGDLYDVVSWPGGGKAVDKAGWLPLYGRRVVLWPDCDAKKVKLTPAEKKALATPEAIKAAQDEMPLLPEDKQPGMSTMLKLAEILKEQECVVSMVDIPAPATMPDGWDVFDFIEGGGTREDVLAFIEQVRIDQVEEAPDPEQEAAPPLDDVPAWIDEVPPLDGDDVAPSKSSSTPSPASAGSKTSRKSVKAQMIPTANGGVKGCRENVYYALKGDPVLDGLVALDQFSLLQVKRRNPPWHSEPGEWTEGDDFQLGMYLATHYGLVIASVGDIEKAVAQVARENGFNPVTDFFDQCADAWDGQSRVETAFVRYWGSLDSEYMRLISTMFFVGLAKRAYVPGIKHDYAPVFEGKQGEGKSTALSILGGEWFADTPFRMGEKDGYLSIQGILIYEIAELEQFNRSEVTAVKAFMSSQKDRYREPYGRRMKNQPRRTVFAATTNQDEYFKDATGNRRFWPVDARKLDLAALRQDREQLIAEAVHLMRKGVKWYPTPEQQRRLIDPHQQSREMLDEWTGRIWEYLEGKDAEGKDTFNPKLDRVSSRQILVKALHFDLNKIGTGKSETTRVGIIMKKLGWGRSRDGSNERDRWYVRMEDEVVAVAKHEDGGDDDLPL
jgi:putative DNA primase/helicase